jgi:hypothetical protein
MGERETGDRNGVERHKIGDSEVRSKETLNGDYSREKSEQAARRRGRGRGDSDSPERGEREHGSDTKGSRTHKEKSERDGHQGVQQSPSKEGKKDGE